MRLHAHTPDCITEEGLNSPFVSPVSINVWRPFLLKILAEYDGYEEYRTNIVSNVGHRLQYIEFLDGLLLHNYERKHARKESSLHSTVSASMIQQHCVLAYSVLEGIGAYMYRVNFSNGTGKLCDLENGLRPQQWHSAIASSLKERINLSNEQKNSVRKSLKRLGDYRHEIHLDTLEVAEKIDFNRFNYNDVYLKAHKFLAKILIAYEPSEKLLQSAVFDEV